MTAGLPDVHEKAPTGIGACTLRPERVEFWMAIDTALMENVLKLYQRAVIQGFSWPPGRVLRPCQLSDCSTYGVSV